LATIAVTRLRHQQIHSYTSPYDNFSIGIQVLESGAHIRRHGHERSHEILFCFRGTGTAEIDGKTYDVCEETMMLIGRGRALLIGLAAYILVAAGWNLSARHTEELSLPGFIVTLMAIPVMRYLARRKIELADQLGSRALRADAMESVTCGWLSVVAIVSLGAEAVSGVWWIDSVGSLAIVWLLVKEGLEAWRGECCADG
jgi:Cation efflux family